MTSGSRFGPEIFRHFFLAYIINLKTVARAALGFWGAVANRGKHALDRVGRPDVLPVFSREFTEGQQLGAVFFISFATAFSYFTP